MDRLVNLDPRYSGTRLLRDFLYVTALSAEIFPVSSFKQFRSISVIV